MELICLPVNDANRALALSLAVAPGQEGMVESVAACLAEAAELALWRPVVLWTEGQAVGFAMYGLWKNEGTDGRLWLDRFFIDGRFQRRGLASALLPALIAHIQEQYGRKTLYLSVYADNAPAMALYERLGFVQNGERDCNGELVMVLHGGSADAKS